MTTAPAKVHISLVDGVLQIEGSEAFVAAQLERLEPHIANAFRLRREEPKIASGESNVNAESSLAKGEAYDHVFAESDGRTRILKKIPGESDSEKTVNAAILLAYAASKSGKESISADDVREVCKSHGCLNQSNFSSYLKAEKQYLIVEGKARSPTKLVKLTVPGRGRAEELFKQVAAL